MPKKPPSAIKNEPPPAASATTPDTNVAAATPARKCEMPFMLVFPFYLSYSLISFRRSNQPQPTRDRCTDSGHVQCDRYQQDAKAVHATRSEQRRNQTDRCSGNGDQNA